MDMWNIVYWQLARIHNECSISPVQISELNEARMIPVQGPLLESRCCRDEEGQPSTEYLLQFSPTQ